MIYLNKYTPDFDWKTLDDIVFNSEVEYDVYKKKNILQLPISFDIETHSFRVDLDGNIIQPAETKEYKEARKCANMYIWQMAFRTYTIYGRTWYDFLEFIYTFAERYLYSNDVHAIIYVHNLAYEFQFIYTFFQWKEIMARKERKPMSAETDINIIFKCSYILSGYSLATVAKNLQSVKITKGKDFDYTIPRNSETELTPEELSYCENDVLIVTYYIQEEIERNGGIIKIPLTQTGYVRNLVKSNCYPRNDRGCCIQMSSLMKELKIIEGIYPQLKQSFAGGFTHANAYYVGDVLYNVQSYDIASSYPTVMVAETFPMSQARFINSVSLETYLKLIENFHVISDITFFNIHARPNIPDHVLSYHKSLYMVDYKDIQLDNGRLVYCTSEITYSLTEVDYKYICQFYEWDKVEIECVQIYQRAYLPKPFVGTILELYNAKTKLKGVPGKEKEYLHAKEQTNSMYGMTVTDIAADDIHFDPKTVEKWYKVHNNKNEQIEKYNKRRQPYLYYPWGIYVTSYARRNILSAVLECGIDYIYSDTDSVKILHGERHAEFFQRYNENIQKKLELALTARGFDLDLLRPKTVKGVEKPLGVFELDGNYTRFKTLGAKRYIYEEDGELHTTIAGVSKDKGAKFLSMSKNPFNAFRFNMVFPPEYSGKLTHFYNDEPTFARITDFQGHTVEETIYSCVSLEASEFKMNITDDYKTFLKENFTYK